MVDDAVNPLAVAVSIRGKVDGPTRQHAVDGRQGYNQQQLQMQPVRRNPAAIVDYPQPKRPASHHGGSDKPPPPPPLPPLSPLALACAALPAPAVLEKPWEAETCRHPPPPLPQIQRPL